MSGENLLLPFLVAIAAAVFAVYAGRAQASRLRNLHVDIANGKLRGILTIAAVIVMVIASAALS